jgi:hypothetical protein
MSELKYKHVAEAMRKFNSNVMLDYVQTVLPLAKRQRFSRSFTPKWMESVKLSSVTVDIHYHLLHYEYDGVDAEVGRSRIVGVSGQELVTPKVSWSERLRPGYRDLRHAFAAQTPPPMVNVEGMQTAHLQMLQTAIKDELNKREHPFMSELMNVPFDPQPSAIDLSAFRAQERERMLAEMQQRLVHIYPVKI